MTFKEHTHKIMEESKKVINILKCASGYNWGESGSSLKRIYVALIRSVLDYGSIVFTSASKTLLKAVLPTLQ